MVLEDFVKYIASNESIINMLSLVSYEEIAEISAYILGASLEDILKSDTGFLYSDGTYVNYEFALKELIKNKKYYSWINSRLTDDISKEILRMALIMKIVPSDDFVNLIFENHFDKMISEDINTDLYWESDYLEELKLNSDNIRTDKPSILICLNRTICDFWEPAKLLDLVCKDYLFELKLIDTDYEINFYLSAKRNDIKPKYEIKKVLAVCPEKCGWKNVELLKDCGLIPYLLYRNYGYEVHMAGVKGDDLTNRSVVPGVIDDYLPDFSEASLDEYLELHARDSELLILRSIYPYNFHLVDKYKALNPNGKVFLPLDANIPWMDRIDWTYPPLLRMLEKCDLIAAAGSKIANFLSEKWPFKIDVITNGFYNFADEIEAFDINSKENIIFHVSRIGNRSKRVDVLLYAFAAISELIPEWKLILAGPVDSEFSGFIDSYFEAFPELKSRVTFLGEVNDKSYLYDLYGRSKIFALSSENEGGPNVFSEALHFGCAIVTTKIDCYEDYINWGECGVSAEINDIEDYAKSLLSLCTDEELTKKCFLARRHGDRNYNMEKNVAFLVGKLLEQD